MADGFVEETTERTQALKSHLEANVCDAQFVGPEQFLRFLYAAFNEVLVRRFIEGLAEQTQKVVARETCFFRDLIEIERVVVTVVNELSSPTESTERIAVG
ncbi:MAG TPA: hypothetical protein VKB46_07960 [Pyrinomonadaceae bacterium]|nr:hypothetical protein [Pyrinomonadaceae bacterium]